MWHGEEGEASRGLRLQDKVCAGWQVKEALQLRQHLQEVLLGAVGGGLCRRQPSYALTQRNTSVEIFWVILFY